MGVLGGGGLVVVGGLVGGVDLSAQFSLKSACATCLLQKSPSHLHRMKALVLPVSLVVIGFLLAVKSLFAVAACCSP